MSRSCPRIATKTRMEARSRRRGRVPRPTAAFTGLRMGTAHDAARRAHHVGRRERRYDFLGKITRNGMVGTLGNFVATDNGLVPFDESAARDLAHDAMLLTLAPEHAERLIEAARTHAFVAAAPEPRAQLRERRLSRPCAAVCSGQDVLAALTAATRGAGSAIKLARRASQHFLDFGRLESASSRGRVRFGAGARCRVHAKGGVRSSGGERAAFRSKRQRDRALCAAQRTPR